jgi:hypothetical protein
MSNGTRLSHLSLATALASVGAGVQAVPRGYTDFTLFQSHASEYSVIQHDFDSATPGEIVDNGDVVDGITFSGITLTGGVSMMVTDLNGSELTSPQVGIGTNSPSGANDNQFQNPDSFVLSFPDSNVFGVWFITTQDTADIFDGDFSVTVSGESQDSAAGAFTPTSGDANAWFIGFIDADSPFRSATISSYDEGTGNFFFRIDDVYTGASTVSAANSLTLLALGAGIIGWRRTRKNKGRKQPA